MLGNNVERGRTRRHLSRFFVVSYLLATAACWPFTQAASSTAEGTRLFSLAAGFTYPALYLLPSALLALLVRFLAPASWRGFLLGLVSVGAVALSLIALQVDGRIYDIYGFHLNGFVLNLVTTRGGLESMGVSDSALLMTALGVGLLVALLVLAWRLSGKLAGAVGGGRHMSWGVGVMFLLWVGQSGWYAWSELRGDVRVLTAARCFPAYLPFTVKGLAEDLGFEPVELADSRFLLKQKGLAYPRAELDLHPPERPYNVLWLVSESWRADGLDPGVMPETWKFAQQNTRFEQHYSGGNGTRMGVFSMFYGLPAPYWFAMLDTKTGPVLMDALLAQDYQLGLYTSAHFTYPEFHETVFARIPEEQLHEANEGRGWERDRQNVGDLLDFMDQRDPARPFMGFLFFESPHARYYFPKESVIREPYLEDFNYATADIARDIKLIENRYINSVHHLDSQFARLLDYLEREDLLDTTIVVMTGDHGEEFMEQGRWGHGSTFVEQQVRVPLILHIPGRAPAVVERMTSHLDLPATLLPLLGVRNDPRDLSLGVDLLGPEVRSYSLIGDWTRLCIVDESYKLVFPVRMSAQVWPESWTRDDRPVPEGVDVVAERQARLVEVLGDLRWFLRAGN